MSTQRDFLDPLRRAVRAGGFPDGFMKACRDNGQFLWAEMAVSSLAYGKTMPTRRRACFTPCCFAEIFRRRLNGVFRRWPHLFGMFKFQVRNREITKWWFSGRIDPGEEGNWMLQ